MANQQKSYELRCPVHGFIRINSWERDIIDHRVFQRLRRIRQLGWTDMVYPGACHTRFEHSLGVMEIATRLFNAVVERSGDLLRDELQIEKGGLERHRTIVRLAALLHDVGHPPFAHAGELQMPARPDGKGNFKHEDYSAAIIREQLVDVIDEHPYNRANQEIKADDIASLIDGQATAPHLLFWRELLSGQMDADRMDYLIRDSIHIGVQYGRFDLDRLVNTVCAVPDPESESLRVGVEYGGWHAAEALIVARYQMFTQVYFHKTRAVYDYHAQEALRALMSNCPFPVPVLDGQPNAAGLETYLAWDDWRALGCLAAGDGGPHGERLRCRHHYRRVWESLESATEEEHEQAVRIDQALNGLEFTRWNSQQSWYKVDAPQILVEGEYASDPVRLLPQLSSIAESIRPNSQIRFYVAPEQVEDAKIAVSEVLGGADHGTER